MSISLSGVSFRYGRKEIFRELDGELETGEVTGIVGPNGIGKTTLLKLLAGFLPPKRGSVTKPDRCMALIEQPVFYPDLSGQDNLEYFLRRKLTAEEKSALPFHAEELLTLPVKKYSMGMRQKLALCLVFLSDAGLLLLDEPTNALDREATEEFIELVKREKANRTIVISSHVLSELEEVADSIYVISGLRLAEKIKLSGEEDTVYEVRLLVPAEDAAPLEALGLTEKSGELFEFFGNRTEVSILIRKLVENQIRVCEVRKKQSFLEKYDRNPDEGKKQSI